MFVGHALLAFALVGGAAALLRDRGAALRLGLIAAAFATVPDVDMSYALVGLAGVNGGALAAAGAFWETSTLVHRAVTHSVLLAPFVAAVAGAWVLGRHRESATAVAAGGSVAVALVVAATLTSGLLGGGVMVTFLAAAVAVAEAVVRFSALSARATFAAALGGLASHPFGDLVTGQPPALLYPLDTVVFAERVTLNADPTLHLLGAFAIELGAIWAGVFVLLWLLNRPLLASIDFRAVAGAGYALAALAIPAPTLEVSYQFVFSVLAVGAVGIVPRPRFPIRFERPNVENAVLTGLAAVTVAGVAYTLAYVLLL
ncbi:MAG: metal-dependent hydrolase, partial [Halolamina sp.]